MMYNHQYLEIKSNKLETDFDDFYLIGDKLFWRMFNNDNAFLEACWSPDDYDDGCFRFKNPINEKLEDVVLLPSRAEVVLSYIKQF